MRALLISTYELGRQPFGLASPAAWLRQANVEVDCIDASRSPVPAALLETADLTAFYLPMHTATRLAQPIIARARDVNPGGHLCAYGLYAPINREWLRSIGVDHVLGGEFEQDLVDLARALGEGRQPRANVVDGVARVTFKVPDRTGLPALARYAALELGDGRRKVVGYTEASRGCRHLCRHCPIVPVYGGAFRAVPADVVLADIDAQVDCGAEHLTFGDPDFFNGPRHAMRLVEALHVRHPQLTYDVTIKIEHLLKHRTLLPTLVETGCLFVTSAVESIDDRVLEHLAKGHTRQDFEDSVALCGAIGLTLLPTFVPFTPWTTLDGYGELLDAIADLDLIDRVAPIQLAIRLLIPRGSLLLDLPDIVQSVESFDPATLTHPWQHADPRVDALQDEIMRIVGRQLNADRVQVFDAIRRLADDYAGRAHRVLPRRARAAVPFVTEPWYCCAEPSPEQLRMI